MKFPLLPIVFALIMLSSFNSCATRVVATTPAKKVAVVKVAPRNHKVVRIKGRRYYRWNGKHYRKTRKGFVVVRI